MVNITGAQVLSLRPSLHSFFCVKMVQSAAHLSPASREIRLYTGSLDWLCLSGQAPSNLQCALGLRISLSFPIGLKLDLLCRWEVITSPPPSHLGLWGQRGEGRGDGQKNTLCPRSSCCGTGDPGKCAVCQCRDQAWLCPGRLALSVDGPTKGCLEEEAGRVPSSPS